MVMEKAGSERRRCDRGGHRCPAFGCGEGRTLRQSRAAQAHRTRCGSPAPTLAATLNSRLTTDIQKTSTAICPIAASIFHRDLGAARGSERHQICEQHLRKAGRAPLAHRPSPEHSEKYPNLSHPLSDDGRRHHRSHCTATQAPATRRRGRSSHLDPRTGASPP